MNDIKSRLDKELEQIRYQQKLEKGLVLTEEDLRVVFRILKENDQELKPLLDVVESLIFNLVSTDYLLMEKYLHEVLRYYNIVENDDKFQCRHKLFFTESKKLVKKPFFSPVSIEKIKDELAIHNITKKL